MGREGAHYRHPDDNKHHHNFRLEFLANISPTQKSIKMGYEDSVYLAKLAEQAERYEGEYFIRYSAHV